MYLSALPPESIDLTFFEDFKKQTLTPITTPDQARDLAFKASHVAFQLSQFKAAVFYYAEQKEAEAKRVLAQVKLQSEAKSADKREAEARTNPDYQKALEEMSKARATQFYLQESLEQVKSLNYLLQTIFENEIKALKNGV